MDRVYPEKSTGFILNIHALLLLFLCSLITDRLIGGHLSEFMLLTDFPKPDNFKPRVL
jgi:hypothetical protein